VAEGPDNTVDDHLRRGRKREREERERERESQYHTEKPTHERRTQYNTQTHHSPQHRLHRLLRLPYLLVLGGDAEYGGEAVHVHGLEELVEVDAVLGEILEILFKN
jgi:hypothetical protein